MKGLAASPYTAMFRPFPRSVPMATAAIPIAEGPGLMKVGVVGLLVASMRR